MSLIEKIREAILLMQSRSWIVDPTVWMKLRDGRTPACIHPIVAVAIANNLDENGNCHCLHANMVGLAAIALGVSSDWVEAFGHGSEARPLSDSDLQYKDAYDIGQAIRNEFLTKPAG